LDNLKLIRDYDWIWLTRLKRNRHANPDNSGNRPWHEVTIAASGTIGHLKGYGFVKVFKIVTPGGGVDYWATNHFQLSELQQLQFAKFA
jgi:hypothetical protein